MNIPLLQVSKFLWCASPQISNPQIFIINPQIHKFPQNTAQLCVKTAVILTLFFAQIWIRTLYAIFERRKACIYGLSAFVRLQKSLGTQLKIHKFVQIRKLPSILGRVLIKMLALLNMWFFSRSSEACVSFEKKYTASKKLRYRKSTPTFANKD